VRDQGSGNASRGKKEAAWLLATRREREWFEKEYSEGEKRSGCDC